MSSLLQNPSSYYSELVDPFFSAPSSFAIRAEHLERYLFAKWFLQRKKAGVVYDIACGDGYGAHILSHVCKKVYGFDISSEFLEIAKECYHGKNIYFEKIDLEKEPFRAADKPDAIVSFETIEHVSSAQNLLSLFARILPPRGYLLLSTPNAVMEPKKHGKSKNPYHKHIFEQEEIVSMLSDAGFDVERIYGQPYTNILMHRKKWTIKLLNIITERSVLLFNLFSFLGKVTTKKIDKSYSIIVVARRR